MELEVGDILNVAWEEAGKYSPSLEAAFRIADVFGRPLDEVLGRER